MAEAGVGIGKIRGLIGKHVRSRRLSAEEWRRVLFALRHGEPMLHRRIALIFALACLSACMPRYHIDVEVLGATISAEPLPGETRRRSTRPYIVVEFRVPPDFAEANRSADLLACNTHRDFVSGHPSNREWAHGGVTPTEAAGVYRALFDVSEFRVFLEPTGNPSSTAGPWRLKPSYSTDGICFRFRSPNVMHYGVSQETRIDTMFDTPLFVTNTD